MPIPQEQKTFTAEVAVDSQKSKATVTVKNTSAAAADCWVRVLFDELDEPEFSHLTAVAANATAQAEFDAPSNWTKGKKRVRVEITLTNPSAVDDQGKPTVKTFSSQEFIVSPG